MQTKFILGFAGILMVVFALLIAVGLCSFAGVKGTLIISEVIPFLVLAIGVDNIFILVNTYEKYHYLRD
jgi:Niemann-Pick C1 protein